MAAATAVLGYVDDARFRPRPLGAAVVMILALGLVMTVVAELL